MVVGLHSSWPAPFTSRVHAWHLPSPFLVPSGIIRLRLYESQEPVSHTQDHLYCRLQENLLDSSWSAFLIYAWVECRRAFFGVFCCRHAEGFGLLRKICGDEASSSRLSNSVTLFFFCVPLLLLTYVVPCKMTDCCLLRRGHAISDSLF